LPNSNDLGTVVMIAMTDELDILKLVAARLGAAGIPYMVSGSMAMNYYAQPRMTRDIDIVIELDAGNVDRVAALFAPDFLCEVEAVREAVRRRGMFNVIHGESIVKVDFIVRKDSAYRLEEFARRRSVDVGGVTVSMVSAEDLLLSKLHWAKDSRSELQLNDARNLIESVPDLDWSHVEKWAKDLSVSDLLAEVRS
jgi:predicted nucleotidyltransferase